MYCSQCGNEVSEGGKFCPACGHNIQETGIKADRNIEIKSIQKGKYMEMSYSQVSFDLPYSAVELTAIQGSVILLTSKGVTYRIAVESFSKAST